MKSTLVTFAADTNAQEFLAKSHSGVGIPLWLVVVIVVVALGVAAYKKFGNRNH